MCLDDMKNLANIEIAALKNKKKLDEERESK